MKISHIFEEYTTFFKNEIFHVIFCVFFYFYEILRNNYHEFYFFSLRFSYDLLLIFDENIFFSTFFVILNETKINFHLFFSSGCVTGRIVMIWETWILEKIRNGF